MNQGSVAALLHDERWAWHRLTVRIRRDLGREVKPEAELLDGKTFRFRFAWVMGDGDPYPGEVAAEPIDPAYPTGSPGWLASGDLMIPEDSDFQPSEAACLDDGPPGGACFGLLVAVLALVIVGGFAIAAWRIWWAL